MCLLVPIIATTTWYHYHRLRVRKEVKLTIKAGLTKKDLVRLSFHKQNLNTLVKWKHSREFQYMADMYDIVLTEESQDSMIYWCWRDHQETELNKKFALALEDTLNHNEERQSTSLKLKQFYNTLFFEGYFFQTSVLPNNGIRNGEYNDHFKSIPQDPIDIPPEFSI